MLLGGQIGTSDAERQVAFFMLKSGSWILAAKGPLTHQSAIRQAGLDPARLSESIFQANLGECDGCEYPFEAGWCRHLYSGVGELLGMLVGFSDGPVLPFGFYAKRAEFARCLATLAIEQANLIEELTFKVNIIRGQLEAEAALREKPRQPIWQRASLWPT